MYLDISYGELRKSGAIKHIIVLNCFMLRNDVFSVEMVKIVWRELIRIKGRNFLMYVIVGLGNPGGKYERTRHNIGFYFIDVLAQKYQIPIKTIKHKAILGKGVIGSSEVMLVKPQTFMNLSGECVSDIMRYYKVEKEHIIVICDDVSLDVGRIRIRRSGSDGGHNGLKNIIYHLNSDEFLRVRIGIGGCGDVPLEKYVLDEFTKGDIEVIGLLREKIPQAVETIVTDGVDVAMNLFNGGS